MSIVFFAPNNRHRPNLQNVTNLSHNSTHFLAIHYVTIDGNRKRSPTRKSETASSNAFAPLDDLARPRQTVLSRSRKPKPRSAVAQQHITRGGAAR